MRAIVSGRRKRVRQATPKWATENDKSEIRLLYRKAIAAGHEVDHIIPLRHPLICGLRVLWNLRVIPELENRKKGNSFTPWSGPYVAT